MRAFVGTRSEERAGYDHRLPSDLAWGNSELEIKRPNKREQDCLHPNFEVLVGMDPNTVTIRSSLNDRESVANTRMGAREEREQVAKDTRERSNGFRDGFPTFRPARIVSLAAHAQMDDAYLNSSASSPHNDFNLCTARIGMRITSPFCNLHVCVTPCKPDVCDSDVLLRT